ncbi:hypothetical protein SteCoe_20054 [Stentor coeruleus]|uniref:EF-hand domain-containing protein n=1 Tax=Stentor coeruleus TaxID=5963 RepID=A0A1R2BSX9_9CILI|nr:hypothetical protein SteCoe_20054 [Stentor coeruleus]
MSIPQAWLHTPKVETQSELLQKRRVNNIPDISFDLDGDGAVGAHDLVLATKFDLDKDGKLNAQERENALKAINQGFTNQFVWGCESSGLNRSFRLVQKRGKVIVDEDFSKIRETYPPLPVDDRQLTRSELESKRKDEAKAEAKRNELRLKTITKMIVPIESFLSKDNYINQPPYSSIHEKKEIERRNARKRIGLSQDPIDIKNQEVAYNYNDKPENISFSEMMSTRRADLVKKLNTSADFSHVTFYEKVEKEKQYIGAEGRHMRDIIGERRQVDVGHFERTFGNETLGIHGRELPKYEENSHEILKHDPFATRSSGQVYDNPFASYTKEHHKIEPKSEEITMKPTQIAHDQYETSPKNKINSKFTTFHSNFMPHSARSQEIYEERMKMINKNGIEKKQFRFLSVTDITPPITQRLLQKNYSPGSKFKNVTSTGFTFK